MIITENLPKIFGGTGEVKGFLFTQIAKSKIAYIYEVKDSNRVYYEIFKRKSNPKCIDFDNRIYDDNNRKEIYPKSKDFGSWAWTTPIWDKAINTFNSLNTIYNHSKFPKHLTFKNK